MKVCAPLLISYSRQPNLSSNNTSATDLSDHLESPLSSSQTSFSFSDPLGSRTYRNQWIKSPIILLKPGVKSATSFGRSILLLRTLRSLYHSSPSAKKPPGIFFLFSRQKFRDGKSSLSGCLGSDQSNFATSAGSDKLIIEKKIGRGPFPVFFWRIVQDGDMLPAGHVIFALLATWIP